VTTRMEGDETKRTFGSSSGKKCEKTDTHVGYLLNQLEHLQRRLNEIASTTNALLQSQTDSAQRIDNLTGRLIDAVCRLSDIVLEAKDKSEARRYQRNADILRYREIKAEWARKIIWYVVAGIFGVLLGNIDNILAAIKQMFTP